MDKIIPLDLTRIKKMADDIRELPAKIDSTEMAQNIRRLLKKYALLAEKIERNVLVRVIYQKDLAKIRTEEFRTIRRTLKEKANAVLSANSNKAVKSEKAAKKTVKETVKKPAKEAVKKSVKASEKKPAKDTAKKVAKDTVKKAASKPHKAAAPKKPAAE